MTVSRSKAERVLRSFRRSPPAPQQHRERREGDEVACSCGARWSAGDPHP